MVNRRQVLQTCAAVGTYLAARRRAWATTVNPLALPLVTSSTPLFKYIGTFNGPSDGSFQYGGTALSVAGSSPGVLGQLCANGLQQGGNDAGIMTIPGASGAGGIYTGSETATTVVRGTTQIPFSVGGSPTTLTGTMLYGGRFFATAAISYDATGAQNAFMAVGNSNVSGFGGTCHANGSAGSINRMFANGMNVVPPIWVPYLNNQPAYIFGGPGGIAGLSIISQQCCGHGFSTFDPATVTAGGAVNLTEWLNFPYFNNTGNPQQVSRLWGYSPATKSNWGSRVGDNYISEYDGPVGCAFIVPGSRSLLFIHMHAYGPSGDPHNSPCEGPQSTASGSNDAPISPDTAAYRRVQVVAYDMAAIIANHNKGGAVDAPRPYAWWEFPNWQTYFSPCGINAGWPCQAWATFDYANNLLYCSNNFGGSNGKIYVFKVAVDSSVLPNPPGNVQAS